MCSLTSANAICSTQRVSANSYLLDDIRRNVKRVSAVRRQRKCTNKQIASQKTYLDAALLELRQLRVGFPMQLQIFLEQGGRAVVFALRLVHRRAALAELLVRPGKVFPLHQTI